MLAQGIELLSAAQAGRRGFACLLFDFFQTPIEDFEALAPETENVVEASRVLPEFMRVDAAVLLRTGLMLTKAPL